MTLCDLLDGGIQKDCGNNSGGITNLYIADFPLVSSYTEAAGEITAITMSGSGVFYEFEFNRNTSSYDETSTINIDNGSTYFAQSVTLIMHRREKTKREAIQKLISGQKTLFIIAKDSNGLYWAFGKDQGCIVTEITGGSGIKKGDSNAYNVVFMAEENASSPEVDAAIIPGLL